MPEQNAEQSSIFSKREASAPRMVLVFGAEWPDLTKPLGASSERRNPANPTLTDAPR